MYGISKNVQKFWKLFACLKNIRLTQRASKRSSPSWAPVRLSRLACWHVREAGASVPNCFSSIAIHGRSQHREIEARFVDLVKLEEYRTCPKASLFLPLVFFLYYLDLEVTHPSGLLLSTAPPRSCHFSMSRKGCNMSLALAIYLMEHQCSSNAANFNGQIVWSVVSFFGFYIVVGRLCGASRTANTCVASSKRSCYERRKNLVPTRWLWSAELMTQMIAKYVAKGVWWGARHDGGLELERLSVATDTKKAGTRGT